MSVLFQNATPDIPNLGRQHFPGFPTLSRSSDDLYPQEGNPPQGWSIAGMLNLHPDTSSGRKKNSVWWAGIANCYWWLDPTTGVAGTIVAQVLPFMGKLCTISNPIPPSSIFSFYVNTKSRSGNS
jgi:hypothetical protein